MSTLTEAVVLVAEIRQYTLVFLTLKTQDRTCEVP
jgi:hypothetical protein